MDISQRLEQQLSGQQLINLRLLQMNAMDLDAYVEELAKSNPVIDPIPELTESDWLVPFAIGSAEAQSTAKYDEFYDSHYTVQDDDYDPFRQIGNGGGLEETLQNTLCLQIDCSAGGEPLIGRMKYLACCLDDDGYLRMDLTELAEELACSPKDLEDALKKLQRIAPPGVGARSVEECLSLQLRRKNADSKAIEVAEKYLKELARKQYQFIAAQLDLSPDEVRKIKQQIAQLEARPGAVYGAGTQTAYVIPEVFVEKQEGRFVLCVNEKERRYFSINSYYCELLEKSDDEEVKAYLSEKIRQARLLRWGIDQRQSTLNRCTEFIVRHQEAFFVKGAAGLVPLSLADVAAALDLNISTISRTVQNKYLSYPGGVVPLSYFFVRKASASQPEALTAANLAVCSRIKKMIGDENKKHPLSDQAICDKLKIEGIYISRRTVAKYRDKMSIPAACDRKAEG